MLRGWVGLDTPTVAPMTGLPVTSRTEMEMLPSPAAWAMNPAAMIRAAVRPKRFEKGIM